VRILIVDDEIAGSKALRPLLKGSPSLKGKSKRSPSTRATAGAPDIGRLVVARAPAKATRRKAKGRAGVKPPANDHLDLGDQPEQASAMLDALGIALLNRGMSKEGGELIELALKIRRKFFGDDHPTTALSLNSYSRVQRERGDYQGATQSAQDALRINRKVYGARGYPVCASLLALGLVQLMQGLFIEAIASAEEGLGILRDVGLHDRDPDTTRLMDVVGRAQCALNQLDESSETFQTLLALDQQQLGTRKHPNYATHLANFGLVLEAQGKRGAAAKTWLNAIDLYVNTLNRDRHPNLIDTYANLGSLLRATPAKHDEAGEYLEKALELGIAIRGESHVLVGNDHANLARWSYDGGARADASRGFATALDIYTRNVRDGALPANHFFIAEVLTWQGRIEVEQDSAEGGKKAEPLLRQAREIWPAQLGPGTVGEAMATGYLGRALALQREDATEACRLLCQGYQALRDNPQANPAIVKQFARWVKEQNCTC